MSYINKLKTLVKSIKLLLLIDNKLNHIEHLIQVAQATLGTLERRIEFVQESLGRVETRQLNNNNSLSLSEYEYRVFSQWGEDGIIQFLIKNLDIETKVFIEFGADNYNLESNTRFLLTNNNWAGLVIDSSIESIKQLKAAPSYWLYNLKAVQSFITKDNINEIIKENGIVGEIGLLSIDIDGNDYWIWQAIDVVQPIIVIVEYNYRFGSDAAVTIPYDENFDRTRAHPLKIYFGASLKALCLLAERKGYVFVGCNSNGVNAFFVRKDKITSAIKEISPEEGYILGQFGEQIEKDGTIIKMSPEGEKNLLMNLGLPLINIENVK